MTQATAISAVRARSALAWWHLLSLDAPSVAAVWVLFAARVTHASIPPLLPAQMFLAVWLIYVADRLLEAGPLQPRHRFHQRHRSPFLWTFSCAAALLAASLALSPPPPAYLPLGAILLGWLALVHLSPRSAALPKEVATGLVFSSAVWAPALPHALPSALAFAWLAILNGLYLHAWEPAVTPPDSLTATLIAHRQAATLLLVPAAAATLAPARPVPLALALSAAALLLLDRRHSTLSPDTLRAAADLALLTPLLLLPFLR